MQGTRPEAAAAPPGDAGAPEATEIRTSIVLPAYNESGNLRPLVEELLDVLAAERMDGFRPAEILVVRMDGFRPAEILVVDDGSTDGTTAELESLAAEYPPVRGVFLRANFGQSAALRAGFDEATGEYLVTLDADGQNDPADIPTLLARLTDGYDCVSGWRTDREDPLSKTIPSRIQTTLATYTGPEIHDFGCTLKAYRREAVADLQLHGEGHRYIPAKLYDRGYDITEEPVAHRPRDHGSSKYGTGRLVRGFVDLLFQVFWNRYARRPMHLLGGAGVVLMTVGGLLGTHAVVSKYAFGASLTPHLPRLILTVALILFGIQLVMFGVLAEMLTRLLYRDDRPYRIERTYDGRDEA